MSNFEIPNDKQSKLIRVKQVMNMTGLSRSYIYALAEQGRFPASVPLVPDGASRAWVESEIQDFINQRIAERGMEV